MLSKSVTTENNWSARRSAAKSWGTNYNRWFAHVQRSEETPPPAGEGAGCSKRRSPMDVYFFVLAGEGGPRPKFRKTLSCVVPRNHHNNSRTPSHSAGASPEPPQGAGGAVHSNAFDHNALTADSWLHCELYNKRVLLIVPSDDTCSKAPNFRLRRSEWKTQMCVSKPCVSGISDLAKSSRWGDGTHTRMWAP